MLCVYRLQIALSAAEAFFRFGGEPHIEFPKSTPGDQAPPFGPQSTASPVPQTIGSQPFASPVTGLGSLSTSVGGHGTLGKAIVGPEVVLSGKHNGLCLYLSRLVRLVERRVRDGEFRLVAWVLEGMVEDRDYSKVLERKWIQS